MRRAFLFIVALISLGCSYQRAVLLPPQTNGPVQIRDLYTIILMIDGGRIDVIDRAVEEGKLPTIQHLFYEKGARFKNALTVFPTVSTPGHQALMSGLYPGHHGTPNLDWFSRPLQRHYDYLNPKDVFAMNAQMFNYHQILTNNVHTDQPQQFFEIFHGIPTMSILEPIQSGATTVFPTKAPILTAYQTKFEKYYEKCDQEAIDVTLDKFQTLPFDQLPRFSFVLLFSTDLIGHYAGPQSERAVDNYIHIDRFIKNLMEVLKQRGIADKTVLVLTSDHGQHEINAYMDVKKVLADLGFTNDQKNPENSDVIFGDHGTAFSHLYFKKGGDWKDRPTYHDLQNYKMSSGKTINLIEAFLNQPHLEWVISSDGSSITHLHRKSAHAVIERQWRNDHFLYRYLPDPGEDPLGYLENPIIEKWVQNKTFVGEEEWLKQTHDLEIPDAVVSIPQIFDDYRVGEMLILTDKQSQFKDLRISSHGSVFAEDKKVPLFLHGPYIQPGVYPYARTVDLYPTLLTLLGVASPGPVDGVVRGEIFSTDFKSLEIAAAKDFGMDVEAFQNYLEEKLKQPLSVAEKEKAIQILYSIEEFKKEKLKSPSIFSLWD